MEKWKKILLLSSGLLVTTILFGFVAFQPIFQAIVRLQVTLKDGTPIRGFYLKLPIPLDFCVYFFNVSNPEAVQQSGAKPALKEVGPFCYNLYKEKIVVDENEEEDSLTYIPADRYYFNPNKSGNLTPDNYVTILHPLLVGMINAAAAQSSPPIMAIVNRAIKTIFQQPESIYLTAKVRDILFDGMTVNCTGSDFPSQAVCSQLKLELPNFVEPEENVYLVSLFGARNTTLENERITVLRGINNSRDLGRLIRYNGITKLDIWSTDECNEYRGTDGWIFPPFTADEDGIYAHSPELCRNIHATYVEDLKMRGIPVKKFSGTLGDQQNNPEDKCYCPTPTTCLKKGILDLSKCLKIPVYATLPHFVNTDEEYLEQVDGLRPNSSRHSLELYLESVTFIAPIEAWKRMQMNFQVQPVDNIDLMETVPTALHPLFWIEEGVVLEGELFRMITNVLLLLKIISFIKIMTLVASLGGIGYAGYVYNQSQSKVVISKPPTQDVVSTIAMTSIAHGSTIINSSKEHIVKE